MQVQEIYLENDISLEDKERVCIITDLARLGKLLGCEPLTTEQFDHLMSLKISVLEMLQIDAQVAYNTKSYWQRVYRR